jgi:hypothetical protein
MKRSVKSLITVRHADAKFLMPLSSSTERMWNLRRKKLQQRAVKIIKLMLGGSLWQLTGKLVLNHRQNNLIGGTFICLLN